MVVNTKAVEEHRTEHTGARAKLVGRDGGQGVESECGSDKVEFEGQQWGIHSEESAEFNTAIAE